MASTSTINEWINELAVSILSTAKPGDKQLQKRHVETFRKRVRYHPYGRTNQFDVEDRLNGLEEKFQIFNRDDLSDSLRERRIELRHYELRWLPDAIDLLLRLSHDPIRQTNATALYDIGSQIDTQDFSWAATEHDEELDTNDPIWEKPTWSDTSSDFDEDHDASTVKSTPQSTKHQRNRRLDDFDHSAFSIYEEKHLDDFEPPSSILMEAKPHNETAKLYVEEIQLVREMLFMIQGYPTSIFVHDKRGVHLDPHVAVRAVSPGMPGKSMQKIYSVRSDVDLIRKWLQMHAAVDYLQTIQLEVSSILQTFLVSVNQFTRSIMRTDEDIVISLLDTVNFLEKSATNLSTVASYIRAIRHEDGIASFDHLYSMISENYYCNNDLAVAVLMPIFIKATKLYMAPIFTWLRHGDATLSDLPSFIRRTDARDRSMFWCFGHEYTLEGQERPPSFLAAFIKDIFTCGKTSEFLRMLQHIEKPRQDLIHLNGFIQKLETMAEYSILPFPAAFHSLLDEVISEMLNTQTLRLKQALNDQCGFTRCLDAFDHIYLRKNGAETDALEFKLFKRMDRCQDNWNDRFVVADLLKDSSASIKCIDADSITVRSIHTSSRSMNSRRRSVKIMGALAIEYTLPWPIANIIPKSSMLAYSRISLHLAQIRRAKYTLERAYPCIHNSDSLDIPRKTAQALNFILLTFVNTLYDHFSVAVIDAMTERMRSNLHAAPTVDEMISVHKSYIHRVQEACLLPKNFKLLHETFINLLDLCVRFADLVSTAKYKTTEDFETSSFMSAQSQSQSRPRKSKRKHKAIQHEDDVLPSSSDEFESSDDEFVSSGEGEGYSSFIVLDDDTSLAIEISKLHIQFRRQLDFFVAGLKGISKAGDTTHENPVADSFDVLAERLSWRSTSGPAGIL